MRIIKEYDERRNEILDAAERLFNSKGYEKCTVNDILKEVERGCGHFLGQIRQPTRGFAYTPKDSSHPTKV